MDGDSLVVGRSNGSQSNTALHRTSTYYDVAAPSALRVGNAAGHGVFAFGNGGHGVVGFGDAQHFGLVGFGALGVGGSASGPYPGVFGSNNGSGNGVHGWSGAGNASGVYGENVAGGFGVAGRTGGTRSAVLGDNAGGGNGVEGVSRDGPGVLGFSGNSYGGVFIGPTVETKPPDSGGLRVVGEIVKTGGEYAEALPHPDGSQRLMYAPLSPESWYEDFGREEIVEGRARVHLDPDFVTLLGIDDDDYHVFLTPEGDSGGLFVTNKSPRGFDVHEQQGGTSGLTFSYRVVAKRRHRQPERLAKLDEPEGLFASANRAG